MKLFYKKFYPKKLASLGYRFNILQAGYVSEDGISIVVTHRNPYQGQILMYRDNKKRHIENYRKLVQFGAVIPKQGNIPFDDIPGDRKTFCVNGKLGIGDLVLSTTDNEYSYLVGNVMSIRHHGAPDHETGNSEDDVYVDFTVYNYTDAKIREIEMSFSEYYDTAAAYDELPLDEVIMRPSKLIRITNIGEDELALILAGDNAAAIYCERYREEIIKMEEE